ncbi:MAG: ATPase domain-containing protein, partial [Myxococcales bacterium]
MTQPVRPSAIAKLPTSVPGLDTITHGGLPKGRATLITGKSGTCKSVLSLQIAANLARTGTKTLVIAVEEEPADLLVTGDSLGFRVTELVRQGALRIVDLTKPMEGPTYVAGSYDLSGLLHRLDAAARELGAKPSRARAALA